MAAAGNITIEHEVRPCIVGSPLVVGGMRALFHKWIEDKNGNTNALVECVYDDMHRHREGDVLYVAPHKIRFLDHKGRKYVFPMEEG